MEPERGGGQILDGSDWVFYTVSVKLGLGDHEKDDGVDTHRNVILCDHRLRREISHLLLQVDTFCDTVDHRDHQVYAGIPCVGISSEAFDDNGLSLRDDTDTGKNDTNNEK